MADEKERSHTVINLGNRLEIDLGDGGKLCAEADDDRCLRVTYKYPNGEEVNIMGIYRMDPRTRGPRTFRIVISNGDDRASCSQIVMVGPDE